ncbi:MAG: NUDIX hydrolase [Candidatus Levybacteria bacterium]|nr:NUDIX hydrolase [Candidatus Levybacteria bacterium]
MTQKPKTDNECLAERDPASQEKITSQKTVFKTKLFNVEEIDYLDKNKYKKIDFVAKRISTVTVLPLTDDNEIFLVRQYRRMLNRTTLEAVAGYIEKRETILEAAKRELKEETGIIAVQWEEIARVEMAASAFNGKLHLFMATGLDYEESTPDEEEEISVIKIPLLDAVEKVMAGEINHTDSMIGILMLYKIRAPRKTRQSKS